MRLKYGCMCEQCLAAVCRIFACVTETLSANYMCMFDKADEISTQHIHKSISHCFKSKVAVSIIGGAAAKLLSDLYQTFLHSLNVRNNVTPSLGSVRYEIVCRTDVNLSALYRYLVRFDMEPKLPRYHDLFGTSL